MWRPTPDRLRGSMTLVLLRFCAVIAVLALPGPAAGQQAPSRATLSNPTATLFEAILKNDIAAVRNSLAAGADIQARNEYGLTPPELAIKKGYYDIAHAILAVRKGQAEAAQDESNPRRRGSAGAPPAPPAAPPAAAAQTPARGNLMAGQSGLNAPAPAEAAAHVPARMPAVPRIAVEHQSLATVTPPVPELPPAPEPAIPAAAEPAATQPAKGEGGSKDPAAPGFYSRVASLFGLVGKADDKSMGPRVSAEITPSAPASAAVPPTPPTASPEAAAPAASAVTAPNPEPAPATPALSRISTAAGETSPPPPAVDAPPAKEPSKTRPVEPKKAKAVAKAEPPPAPPKPPAPKKKVTEPLPTAGPSPEAPQPTVQAAEVASPAPPTPSEGPPVQPSRVATIGGPVFAPAGVPPAVPIISAPIEPAVVRPPSVPASPPVTPSVSSPASPPAPVADPKPAAAEVAAPAAEPEPTVYGRLKGILGFGEKDLQAKEKPKGETQKTLPDGTPVAGVARVPRFTSVRPLQDVNLGEGLSLKLGQAIASGAATDRCLSKRGAKTWFCVEPAVWPADVQDILAAGTALYSGSKAIVRYDDGRAGHIHALFPSREFAAVAGAFERRFGPPTDREDASMAIVGEPAKTNPVVRWKSLNSSTSEVEVIELRTFDDLRGMIPDTEYGVLRYYRSESQAVFVHLTTADLMLLRSRKTE